MNFLGFSFSVPRPDCRGHLAYNFRLHDRISPVTAFLGFPALHIVWQVGNIGLAYELFTSAIGLSPKTVMDHVGFVLLREDADRNVVPLILLVIVLE